MKNKENILVRIKRQPQKKQIYLLADLLIAISVFWSLIHYIFNIDPLNSLSLMSYNIPFIITFKIRDKQLKNIDLNKTFKDYVWDNAAVWTRNLFNICLIIKAFINFTNVTDVALTVGLGIAFFLYDMFYNRKNIAKDRNDDIPSTTQGHIYRSNDRQYIRKEIDKYYKENATKPNEVIKTNKKIKEMVEIAGGPHKIKTYCFDKKVEEMWPCPPNRKKKSKIKNNE